MGACKQDDKPAWIFKLMCVGVWGIIVWKCKVILNLYEWQREICASVPAISVVYISKFSSHLSVLWLVVFVYIVCLCLVPDTYQDREKTPTRLHYFTYQDREKTPARLHYFTYQDREKTPSLWPGAYEIYTRPVLYLYHCPPAYPTKSKWADYAVVQA